jgi:hypothetical protein
MSDPVMSDPVIRSVIPVIDPVMTPLPRYLTPVTVTSLVRSRKENRYGIK